MRHKELFAWLKFHDIFTGKGKRYERVNKEELLAPAERTWNAIQNDDLGNFRKTLQLDKGPLKVPQTREDLGQMRLRDLVQWIGSQGVAVEERNMKRGKALALAQKIWDAAENGTIDKMKKRRQSSRNSVRIPQVREDFRQMTQKDLQQWINSHELRVKDSHRTKKDVVAQAKGIWAAINDNTLDKLKKRDHAKRTQRGRSERISVF
jgi:hypothetical protein